MTVKRVKNKARKKKDAFKVFDDVKKKGQGELKKEDNSRVTIDSIMSENSFIEVPAEAFRDIYDYPEYEYLKEGIYVSKKKIIYSETIDAVAEWVKHSTPPKEGEIINTPNWYEAKFLAKDLYGHIPTPAEFFHIRDYVRKKGDAFMFLDMTTDGQEWFDARVQNELMQDDTVKRTLYVHNEVEGLTLDKAIRVKKGVPTKQEEDIISFEYCSYTPGKSYDMPAGLQSQDYFDHCDLDPRTGMPTRWNMAKGELFFFDPSVPFHEDKPMLREFIPKDGSEYIMSLSLKSLVYKQMGTRLIYRKSELDKK